MGLKRLKADIDSGFWLEKYGDLLNQRKYDAGYRILATITK
jgi:hypothetical protein